MASIHGFSLNKNGNLFDTVSFDINFSSLSRVLYSLFVCLFLSRLLETCVYDFDNIKCISKDDVKKDNSKKISIRQ